MDTWVRRYREQRESGFKICFGNAKYSSELKKMCVEVVLHGEVSIDGIVAKYHISSRAVLWSRIGRYNFNQELNDYNPK